MMGETRDVIAKCPCGQKNRMVPNAPTQRCGKCHRQFTSAEVLDAYRLNGAVESLMDTFKNMTKGMWL